MMDYYSQKQIIIEQVDFLKDELKRYQSGITKTFSWEENLRRDVSSEKIERFKSDILRFETHLDFLEKLEVQLR